LILPVKEILRLYKNEEIKFTKRYDEMFREKYLNG